MSRQLEEGRILDKMALSSFKEIGLNWLSRETQLDNQSLEYRKALFYVFYTLCQQPYPQRMIKNVLSSLEKTGTGEWAGLTNLSIVPNKALGFFLLTSIRLEK